MYEVLIVGQDGHDASGMETHDIVFSIALFLVLRKFECVNLSWTVESHDQDGAQAVDIYGL